ncbi:MAG TPA: host attachment protein [Arsenicitalea sp.]|jgi:protein required for attachment to host cells|nr:host attachment protein [Arsenicitalea sp.]
MKPVITWVLVADGDRAKIFENCGPGKGLACVDGLELEQEHLRARDIMADKQGRSFSSVGHGRSAMEYPTDPVEQREAQFAKSMAELLDRKLSEGAFNRLIIAAAPNALGDIRPCLSAAVNKTVMAELPKDLTNIPAQQLGDHFKDILAV